MDENASGSPSEAGKAVEAGGAGDGAELGDLVRSTVSRLLNRFRSERATGSLGDTTLEVLSRLQKHGPASLTELSDHYGVAPASMSQTVNRLTSAGYAERNPDPADGRKVVLSATADGAALALAARSQRNAWLNSHLAALSPSEKVTVEKAILLLNEIATSQPAD